MSCYSDDGGRRQQEEEGRSCVCVRESVIVREGFKSAKS